MALTRSGRRLPHASDIVAVHYRARPGSGMGWLTLRTATGALVEMKVSRRAVMLLARLLSQASVSRLGPSDTRNPTPAKS